MSESTTTAPKPVSEKQLRANRSNCLKSTGPSIEGRKRSCRNNLIHGMRSSQMILPGESPEELAELREEIHDAVQPRDGVEKLLAERVVRHAWFVRRGEGVRDDRATEKIHDTVERAADDEARAVDVLAARLEEGPERYDSCAPSRRAWRSCRNNGRSSRRAFPRGSRCWPRSGGGA